MCIKELINERQFRKLQIWEPGLIGPFRRFLRRLSGYEQTAYRPDAKPGELRDGVRHEDLMATTFASDTFDLIITSDIFEHVRAWADGFREIFRVLRPGGSHVFTIPITAPWQPTTVPRVDISGAEDVFLVEPAYHGPHLVYNEFGSDLLEMLDQIGFATEVVPFESTSANAARLLTLCSTKPEGNRPSPR